MMNLTKSIYVLRSSLFLLPCWLFMSIGNIAWAAHGGGFSGGHGGMAGGHGSYGAGGYRGGYGHGYGRGYGYYGGFYGGAYLDPWAYGVPFGYGMVYPDAVVLPDYPQAYVGGGTLPLHSADPSGVQQTVQSNDWYYCQNSGTYYPYVKTCANGWQRVPSIPPQ